VYACTKPPPPPPLSDRVTATLEFLFYFVVSIAFIGFAIPALGLVVITILNDFVIVSVSVGVCAVCAMWCVHCVTAHALAHTGVARSHSARSQAKSE
jgi:hypothetical protein